MAVEEDSEAQERQGNGETETLNPLGTGQDAPNNPGQDAPNNPPSQDDAVDGEVQARFMERALAESLRLRREAVRLCVAPAPPRVQSPPALAACAMLRARTGTCRADARWAFSITRAFCCLADPNGPLAPAMACQQREARRGAQCD